MKFEISAISIAFVDSTENTWLLLRSPPADCALNMALDEALLEAMPGLGRPVLRFYNWTAPAASFGYFQRYQEVEPLTLLRPLVRRPTAGGLVPHNGDWTYCICFPSNDEWYSLRANQSYEKAHTLIKDALCSLGIAAELAPAAKKTLPGQCFSGYERFDVIYGGTKIAGAAQRRRREGLLIQGSVQSPRASLSSVEWQQAVVVAARKQFAIQWNDFEPDESLHIRAEELAGEKYSQAAYNLWR